MYICGTSGLTPMRNVGGIQSFYENEFRKALTTNRFKDNGENLNTEEFKKGKDVIVENDFNRLLRFEERAFNSKLSEKMESVLSTSVAERRYGPNRCVLKKSGYSPSIYDNFQANFADRPERFRNKFNGIKPLDDRLKNKEDLFDKIEILYNDQKQLLEKYSEKISKLGNEIISFIMNHKDIDGDGALSSDEAGKMSDKISKADTDRDGLIVKEELLASLEEIFLFDQREIVSKLLDKLNNISGAPTTKESKM